jgi:hypothetical protein
MVRARSPDAANARLEGCHNGARQPKSAAFAARSKAPESHVSVGQALSAIALRKARAGALRTAAAVLAQGREGWRSSARSGAASTA